MRLSQPPALLLAFLGEMFRDIFIRPKPVSERAKLLLLPRDVGKRREIDFLDFVSRNEAVKLALS